MPNSRQTPPSNAEIWGVLERCHDILTEVASVPLLPGRLRWRMFLLRDRIADMLRRAGR